MVECDTLILIFKLINGLLPDWVLGINLVGDRQIINTRQSGNLPVPRTRTMLADRALSVRGPVLWNSIPQNIRRSNNLKTFKNELRKYFNDN